MIFPLHRANGASIVAYLDGGDVRNGAVANESAVIALTTMRLSMLSAARHGLKDRHGPDLGLNGRTWRT